MIVRMDTTNLARGLSFEIIAYAKTIESVSIYGFNTSTYKYELLQHQITQDDSFFKISAIAPIFDGFLLVKINDKSLIVKKIGVPTPHFVVAYKSNYTIAFKLFDDNNRLIKQGNWVNIVDGFYYVSVPYELTIMEVLKKRFLLKNDFLKLWFDVTLGDATLGEVTLDDYMLRDVMLGEVMLEDVTLTDIRLNTTLPTIDIKGY